MAVPKMLLSIFLSPPLSFLCVALCSLPIPADGGLGGLKEDHSRKTLGFFLYSVPVTVRPHPLLDGQVLSYSSHLPLLHVKQEYVK
jgi:hypothetical protein